MYCKLVKVSVDVLHELVLLVVVSLLRGKLNRRLSSSSGVDTFEATLARDVLTPSCAHRMILLTSSSIPSSAMSNAGGRECENGQEWAGFFKEHSRFFGFSPSRKQN